MARAKKQLQRESGHVKWFERDKHFGFIITDSGEEIFFHRDFFECEEWKRECIRLKEGHRLEFKVVQVEKGPMAVAVTEIGGGPIKDDGVAAEMIFKLVPKRKTVVGATFCERLRNSKKVPPYKAKNCSAVKKGVLKYAAYYVKNNSRKYYQEFPSLKEAALVKVKKTQLQCESGQVVECSNRKEDLDVIRTNLGKSVYTRKYFKLDRYCLEFYSDYPNSEEGILADFKKKKLKNLMKRTNKLTVKQIYIRDDWGNEDVREVYLGI